MTAVQATIETRPMSVPVILTVDREPALCVVPAEPEYDLHSSGHRRPYTLLHRFVRGLPPVTDPNACFLWTRALDTGGYGKIRLDSDPDRAQFALAHRLAWFIEWGNIPAGLMVNHRCCSDSDCLGGIGCHHRRCVNPRHLELATPGFNQRLSVRNQRGPGNGLRLVCGHQRTAGNVSLRAGVLDLACRVCA